MAQRSNNQELTILSWNISQAMAIPRQGLWQISASSPSDFNPLYAALGISSVISDSKADIVLLQELPSQDGWKQLPGHLAKLYSGLTLGGAESHSGYCVVLISHLIRDSFKICFEAIVGPTQIAVFSYHSRKTGETTKLAIIGGHLSPSNKMAANRASEIDQAILVAREQHCDNIIFGGDLNMRNAETRLIYQKGLRDAFVELGNPKNHEFTWNSRKNKYHSGGYSFTCRFDRFLFSGRVAPVNLEIIGDKPVTNYGSGSSGGSSDSHYLSDHYGLITRWDI